MSNNEYFADEAWIGDRWGGFLYLDIGRNEDFRLEFENKLGLWLCFERRGECGKIMLFDNPTRQQVIDAERMFGCSDETQ